ncbi:DUF4190 domain-containing protein [Streptomyces sp. NPDC049916]|uniref:DUF4190 domain-containing protein n=1 Tax=Streptomyces sp. NPDC049916 TaxID=3155156 RepID=UPI00342908AE
MSDNTEQPGGGAAPRDPWAPPDSRVELDKPGANTPPPTVHEQPTVTSMPSAGPAEGPGPAPAGGGFGPASSVPPPPIAPHGPGPGPGAGPGHGHPTPPPSAGHYGYPAPPPPAYGGYPGYGGYGMGPAGWAPAPSNGLGTAAMVLGIISVVGFCLYGLNIVLGILALIFGIIGLGRAKRGEATNRGMALAGVILGCIGMVIGSVLLGIIIWAAANSEDGGGYDESDPNYDDPFATSLVVGGGR